MQMQVKNGLARTLSAVYHCSVPLEQIQFACELRRHEL